MDTVNPVATGSRQRMVAALERRTPDRLPVTTHHLMPYFLKKYMGGMTEREFFDHFGMDAITWILPTRPFANSGTYPDPTQTTFKREQKRIVSDDWRITCESLGANPYQTDRYRIHTPDGELSCVLQQNEHTTWVMEHLIKEKTDIELLTYATAPACDVEFVNRESEACGDRGIIRGHIVCFELFGQPGCWQDASCLVGIERLIMETYRDPEWVHELIRLVQRRKLKFVSSLAGARYDVLELGGGDASSTVISPRIFEEFVAPYDSEIIRAAHAVGQRIVYHTCGGMMPFLELLAGMGPDALETLTPRDMGGDMRLAEAKQRVGEKVCMIGGFDQFHFFEGCSPEQTRAEVRRCFEEAGGGGGFILSPSDHFFDAEPELIAAFADEARQCVYEPCHAG